MNAPKMPHTPGPWVVADGNKIHDRATRYDESGVRVGGTPNRIATVHSVPSVTNFVQDGDGAIAANARLIAAAPDMLVALKKYAWDALSECSACMNQSRICDNCRAIKDAIDKAEGQMK